MQPGSRRFVDRRKFAEALSLGHSVRLHAMLLLGAATLSGLLVSKWLLWLGLAAPYVRFPVAVLAGYGLFLLFVELWLRYLGLRRWSAARHLRDGIDGGLPNVGSSGGGSSGGGSSIGGGLRGGGGTFDGGGASSSFEAGASKAEGLVAARSIVAPAAAGSSGSSGSGDSDAGDAVEGAAALLPVLLLVAVVVGIAVAAGWVIVVTPDILVEVATEVAVASGLIRSTARTRGPSWFALLFQRSIPKAALLAFLAMLLGVAVRWVDPGADTIGQVVARLTGA